MKPTATHFTGALAMVVASIIATTMLVSHAPAIEKPAAGGTTRLEAKEIDRILDGVFARAAKITRLRARLVTSKQGSGFFKRKTVSHELLKLAAPDLVCLLNFGSQDVAHGKQPPLEQCGLLVMDGSYLWELDPREEGEKTRLATRRKWKAGSKRNAAGLAGVLSYVVLGGEDVRSAAELRRRFMVSGWRQPRPGEADKQSKQGKETYRFLLQRKDVQQAIELWIEPGRTIPWKVRSMEQRKLVGARAGGGKARTRLHVEERLLLEVRTNLDGLKPFPAAAFAFPLAPDIEVDDADTGKDNLDHKQLARELDAIKTRIEQARTRHDKVRQQAPPPVGKGKPGGE